MKIISILLAGMAMASTALADDAYFKFYTITPSNKVGLRNTGNDCRIAVLNFNYNNGKHELREFKVAGHASVEIDISRASLVQIIDHKDCK